MNSKNRDLTLVYFISFMDLFAVGLTVPLLSNHLTHLGASHFTIGLLSSIYSGLQVISGPIIGSWSDIKNRKTVLKITLLSCSVSYFFLGFAKSVISIALIRIILGISKHTQSICKAIITDILPINKRAAAFGKSSALGSFGFIIGPSLGGFLSEYNNGFRYVCLLTSLLFIINTVTCSFIKDTNRKPESIQNGRMFSKFLIDFKKSIFDIKEVNWTDLWDTFLLRFIFGFSITLYFSQQSLYLKDRFNLSQKHTGFTISFFSAAGMISAFLLHFINNYFYKNDDSCLIRLSHFFALMTISLVTLYLSPNIQIFLVILVPFSISCTVLRIVSMELMLKKVRDNHRGSLAGVSNSIMSVARFVTPVCSGLISEKVGGEMMLMAAVAPLIGTIVSLRMYWTNDKIDRNRKKD